MRLRKPLKDKECSHLFMLYNNECTVSGDSNTCTQVNALATCGSGSSDGFIKCTLTNLFNSCKK